MAPDDPESIRSLRIGATVSATLGGAVALIALATYVLYMISDARHKPLTADQNVAHRIFPALLFVFGVVFCAHGFRSLRRR